MKIPSKLKVKALNGKEVVISDIRPNSFPMKAKMGGKEYSYINWESRADGIVINLINDKEIIQIKKSEIIYAINEYTRSNTIYMWG